MHDVDVAVWRTGCPRLQGTPDEHVFDRPHTRERESLLPTVPFDPPRRLRIDNDERERR